MFGWHWVQQRIHDYRLKRATFAVINDKQGYAARSWPLLTTAAAGFQSSPDHTIGCNQNPRFDRTG